MEAMAAHEKAKGCYSLRDKKAQELFSHARVKQIMRQLQHLPVIPRLTK